MYIAQDGMMRHVFTSDPHPTVAGAAGGQYVGSCVVHPGEGPVTADTILQRIGLQIHEVTFDYDFAVTGDPSAATAISDLSVPAGALVIGGWYKVLTTFTTAGADAGTIALGLNAAATDLKAAIAVSDASNPWDVDLTKVWPLLANATALAAASTVKIISATQAVTAGKLHGGVWYKPNAVGMSNGH